MAQDVGFKKASKEETDYGTGAKRDSRGGKGAQKWLPHDAIDLVSHVYEVGNTGRGWRNWEFGMPLEDLLDSAKRHIVRHIAGDRSEPHISQAIWNLLNYLQMSIWIWQGIRPQALNNLPDHRHFWYPDMPPPPPLSPKEIEWLQSAGLTQDTAHVDDKYLAGIVDGEGTIAIPRDRKWFTLRLTVYNNSYPLLQKLLAHFPAGNINQCRVESDNHAASFLISWSGKAALEVVRRIAPFLVVKKRQADLAIEWFMITDMQDKGFLTEEQRQDALASIKSEMHMLNKKGSKEANGSDLDKPELNLRKKAADELRRKTENFILSSLSSGICKVRDLLREAKKLGISKDILKRSKDRLGVVSTGIGSKSCWVLPAIKTTVGEAITTNDKAFEAGW